MKPETRVIPLRWIFPVSQLVLCIVILWPVRPTLVYQIRATLRDYGMSRDKAEANRVRIGSQTFLIDLSDPDEKRRVRSLEAREWAVAGLDLPGGLPDLIYAVISPSNSVWMPKGMYMHTWRDLSWPIIGTFFWWIAGRSVEVLLLLRQNIVVPKIRWWELVLSLAAMAYGAIWAAILFLDRSARTEFSEWILLGAFGSMWLALGSCTWLAYFRQWRSRRRLALD
jgi:hypothetical protein